MSLVKSLAGSLIIRPAMKVEDLIEKLKSADPRGDVYIHGIWCNRPFRADYDVKIDIDGQVVFDIGGVFDEDE